MAPLREIVAVDRICLTLIFSAPENSVPPDVTSSTPQERGSRVDLPPAVRGMSRGQSRSSMLDTADGTLTRVVAFMNTSLYRYINQSDLS